MEISFFYIGLRLALGICVVLIVVFARSDQIKNEALPINCNLQGTARTPAFSMDGEYIIGSVFSIHYKELIKIHNYTTVPEPPICTGRFVKGWSGGEWRKCYTKKSCFDLYDVELCCKVQCFISGHSLVNICIALKLI